MLRTVVATYEPHEHYIAGMYFAYFLGKALHCTLRSSVAAIVVVTLVFMSPAMSQSGAGPGPASVAAHDAVPPHCHMHSQQTITKTNHMPATHLCCVNSTCSCSTATACVGLCTPVATQAPQRTLLIPTMAHSSMPQGLRSPVFRPPIA
jgi:hypothetical protein